MRLSPTALAAAATIVAGAALARTAQAQVASTSRLTVHAYVANPFVDGTSMRTFDDVDALRPADSAVIEPNAHALAIPPEFTASGPARECGAVVPWTRNAPPGAAPDPEAMAKRLRIP